MRTFLRLEFLYQQPSYHQQPDLVDARSRAASGDFSDHGAQ
jgi:hypothetical protein